MYEIKLFYEGLLVFESNFIGPNGTSESIVASLISNIKFKDIPLDRAEVYRNGERYMVRRLKSGTMDQY